MPTRHAVRVHTPPHQLGRYGPGVVEMGTARTRQPYLCSERFFLDGGSFSRTLVLVNKHAISRQIPKLFCHVRFEFSAETFFRITRIFRIIYAWDFSNKKREKRKEQIVRGTSDRGRSRMGAVAEWS